MQTLFAHARTASKPTYRGHALLLAAVVLCVTPAFAANKDMIQLQTQVQQLQDAVARLQQSNDERMGVMKDLVQQNADSVNKMAIGLGTLQRQMQTQQEAQGAKIDQVSGQIQSLNDSLDEVKARLGRMEKVMQDIQGQQQSMNANMSSAPSGAMPAPAAGGGASDAPMPTAPVAEPPAPAGKKGKSSAAGPPLAAAPVPALAPEAPTAPPAADLYKTALGDYMSAKYSLAASEFSDVTKFYPDNPLAGNSFYYQAEIEYRDGHYAAAIKDYDHVIDQFPDSNKVPVSHLHKGQALIALKQTDAGVREMRSLIQRFPNSPEAMQARSKLSGMGITVTPRR
jgi:TolA-binding protein